MNGETEIEAKPIDISFFVDKYLIPLVERKWVVVVFFLLGAAISLIIFWIVQPEYVTEATILIKEPISQSSEIKKEGMGSGGASRGYVTAEAEKIKSASFAAEVFKGLPDQAKEDFRNPLDLASQIMGRSVEIEDPLGEGEQTGTPTYFVEEGELLSEMFSRLEVRENIGAGLIYLTARTLNPANGPIILRSYIDVWQATNLADNKKVARAESRFSEAQRNEAERKFLKSEENLITFKTTYDIPVELNMARDMELQRQMERLQSQHKMDKERFTYLDRILLETRMQEAGIQGNVHVINEPALPRSPSRTAVTRLMAIVTLGGLAVGIGIVLVLDYIKGPIRHEKDISSVVRIPMMGTLPKV